MSERGHLMHAWARAWPMPSFSGPCLRCVRRLPEGTTETSCKMIHPVVRNCPGLFQVLPKTSQSHNAAAGDLIRKEDRR